MEDVEQGRTASQKPVGEPGAAQRDGADPSASPASAAPPYGGLPVPQVRPWVRFWARMFDINLSALVVGIMAGLLVPQLVVTDGGDVLLGALNLLLWLGIETVLLATLGTTPGKWLFRVRLIPPAGGRPSFGEALQRSTRVWWRGMAIGVPIVNLITLLVAHGRLTREGVTSWDREGGFTVRHGRIGPLRIIVAVTFFLATTIFAAWILFLLLMAALAMGA